MSLSVSATTHPAPSPPAAIDCVSYSWSSAVVLIPASPDATSEGAELTPGDRIVALAPDGTCVGETTWDSTGTSLTIWADDPDTRTTDGLADGDALSFMVYPPSESRRPSAIAFQFRPSATPGKGPAEGFRHDEVYVVKSALETASEDRHQALENVLRPIQPNPVVQDARIPLSLGAAAEVRVDILDALGRRVTTLFDGPLEAGEHALPLDSSQLASGIYVCWVRSGGKVFQRRFTVVR